MISLLLCEDKADQQTIVVAFAKVTGSHSAELLYLSTFRVLEVLEYRFLDTCYST